MKTALLIAVMSALTLRAFCADVYYQEKDASGVWVNQTKLPDGSVIAVSLAGSGTGSTTLGYTVLTATTSGTIAAGARALSFAVQSGTASLIATGTVALSGSGSAYNFPIPVGFAMPAVPYTVSAGGLVQIIELY